MDIARNKVVGEVLACVRREHDLTQEDLARLTGRGQSSISKIEIGESRLPLFETFLFCAAMGEEPGTFVNRVYLRLTEEGYLPYRNPED